MSSSRSSCSRRDRRSRSHSTRRRRRTPTRRVSGTRYPPGPVRRGGVWLRLYANSLAVALFGLFVFSLVIHAVGGTWAYDEEQMAHGGSPVSILSFVTSSEFWFQSMQNWQSEFLAVASIVFLGIYLRQHGSPESKPVAAPHDHTGS